jgi:FkbM family methyltransferase
MYYGQFNPPTDKIIEEYFPNKRDGVAVEVGAAHGVAASNTLHFEQLGWKCLCIEPNPNLYAQLKRNRKHTLNYAISYFNEDNVDFQIALGVDETVASALKLDPNISKTNNVKGFKIVKVNVRTLDFCLENFYTPIDFISIDTEGNELEVLMGFNIHKYYPKLFIIEDNQKEIEEYLLDFGYKKIRKHGVNDFYGTNDYNTFD